MSRPSLPFIAQVAQGLVEGTAIPNQAQTSFGGEDVLSDDGVVGENQTFFTDLITIGVIPTPDLTITTSRRADRGCTRRRCRMDDHRRQ